MVWEFWGFLMLGIIICSNLFIGAVAVAIFWSVKVLK